MRNGEFVRGMREMSTEFFILHSSLLCRLVVDANSFQVPFIEQVDTLVYLNLVVPSQCVQLADVCQFA